MSLLQCWMLHLCWIALTNGDTSITSDLLWPQPAEMNFGTDVYSIDATTFSFLTKESSSALLRNVVNRYYNIILKSSIPLYPTGGNSVNPTRVLNGLKVIVNSPDETLDMNTDESC